MFTRLTFLSALFALLAGLIGFSPTLAASPAGEATQQAYSERIFVPAVSVAPKVNLRVLSHRSYTQDGVMYIVGEVINESSIPVYAIELQATLYNSANQVIGTETGYGVLEETRPGQRNPFIIYVFDTPGVARYDLRISSSQTSSLFVVQPLTIVSQQTRNNEGPEVFGEVSNATSSVLRYPVVVATLYDAAGNVVDVLPNYSAKEVLRPGERSIYQLNAYRPVSYSRYTVQGEAVVAPSTTQVPNLRKLSDRSYNYDAQGYRYIVGEAINDSSFSAYYLSVEARFFNSANQLVAVAGGYGLLDQTQPGKRTPFSVFLENPPTGIARYELVVSGSPDAPVQYRSLNVLSKQVRNNGGIEAYGEVRNDTSVELHYPNVAATFYDSTGKVVEVGWGSGDAGVLAPGARTSYTAPTFNTFTYSSSVVQAEGHVQPAEPLAQRASPVLQQRQAIERDPRRQQDTTPMHTRVPDARSR
jgi:hypothetical protein